MRSKIYLLSAIFIIPLISCEQQDAFEFETETAIHIDMMIATSEDGFEKSEAGSSEVEYVFAGEGTYKGTRVTSVENRLYRINEVKPHKKPLLSISGLPEGSSFNSLQLEWGFLSPAGAGYTMHPPVDLLLFENISEDGDYKIVLDNALIQLISSLNSNPENTILVKLSGNSSSTLLNSASLEIPVLVKSSTLSPRFELF